MLFLVHYTNHTKGILDETKRSSQLSQQPLLDFWAEYDDPFKFENKGTGPALNIVLMQGYATGEMFYSAEKDILSALSVGKTTGVKKANLIKANKDEIIKKVSYASDLITELSEKDNNWLCLIYEDVFKNKFATIINGTGNEYYEMIEFKKINNSN